MPEVEGRKGRDYPVCVLCVLLCMGYVDYVDDSCSCCSCLSLSFHNSAFLSSRTLTLTLTLVGSGIHSSLAGPDWGDLDSQAVTGIH
jgi:hypothetical protein